QGVAGTGAATGLRELAKPRTRSATRDPVAQLLDAVKNERESSTVLTIDTALASACQAVVPVKPMHGASGDSLAALVTLKIPTPSDEEFVDPGVMRNMLLHETFQGIENTLDFAEL